MMMKRGGQLKEQDLIRKTIVNKRWLVKKQFSLIKKNEQKIKKIKNKIHHLNSKYIKSYSINVLNLSIKEINDFRFKLLNKLSDSKNLLEKVKEFNVACINVYIEMLNDLTMYEILHKKK